jgi:transcription antitermination factor NusG
MERQDVILTLAGEKPHVKSGRDGIKSLFESIQTKIYNSEVADRKGKICSIFFCRLYCYISAIYWSKYIFSDMAINVIQQIMDNEKIYTVWDKTEALSGFYKVMYFTLEPFVVSEVDINQILNREIAFIDDIKMPDEKTKNFLKEIEQFVVYKRQPELAIIHCKYPYQTKIKISVFGRKKLVKIVGKQLQLLINKYTLKPFTIKMTSIQVTFSANILNSYLDSPSMSI